MGLPLFLTNISQENFQGKLYGYLEVYSHVVSATISTNLSGRDHMIFQTFTVEINAVTFSPIFLLSFWKVPQTVRSVRRRHFAGDIIKHLSRVLLSFM